MLVHNVWVDWHPLLSHVVMKVEQLEKSLSSCILKRWIELAKSHLGSPLVNGMKNDVVHIVWYNSLRSMCNKLSYYVSQSLTSLLQAKNEIESVIMKIKELCNINLKGKNLGIDEAIGHHQVCDQWRLKEIQAKLHHIFKKEDM